MKRTVHAATISSGVAMAFASTRPGSVMATTTARIGAMSSIVKEGVLSTSLGVTVELAFLSELVATEHGNVQMARMKTSARRPLAGLTSSGVAAAVA
uniref:Putative secreted protein n=1 Tax=Ixodes ricinus TaxID=34613 RepID=A0A6B0UFM5_IXORI